MNSKFIVIALLILGLISCSNNINKCEKLINNGKHEKARSYCEKAYDNDDILGVVGLQNIEMMKQFNKIDEKEFINNNMLDKNKIKNNSPLSLLMSKIPNVVNSFDELDIDKLKVKKNNSYLANLGLGISYIITSKEGEVEYEKGIRFIKKSAEKGDELSQLLLGGFYFPKNIEESLEWYEKAMDKGSSFAKMMYSYISLTYAAEKKDIKLTEKHLKKASEKGSIIASLMLGSLYLEGYEDFPAKLEKGKKILMSLCDDGIKVACEELDEYDKKSKNKLE